MFSAIDSNWWIIFWRSFVWFCCCCISWRAALASSSLDWFSFLFFYNWFIFFSNVFYFIWCPLTACEPTLVNFINRRQAAHLKRALTSWSPADIGPILSINSLINLIVMGVSNGKGTWREPLARWKEKVNSRKEEGKKKNGGKMAMVIIVNREVKQLKWRAKVELRWRHRNDGVDQTGRIDQTRNEIDAHSPPLLSISLKLNLITLRCT